MTETTKPNGRPSIFTEELAAVMLIRISGGESVRSIARDQSMPGMTTLFKWLKENESFAKQYAQACEIRAEAVFDEMFEISDDGSNDWMERNHGDDKESGWYLNGEHVQRSKLRVDVRKK